MEPRSPTPDELNYTSRREAAAERHNAVLSEHVGRGYSTGRGLMVICLCGGQFQNSDSWRDHLVAVCADTPINVQ